MNILFSGINQLDSQDVETITKSVFLEVILITACVYWYDEENNYFR